MDSQSTGEKTKLTVPRADVQVGQKVWANMVIDNTALIRPERTMSDTAEKFVRGFNVYLKTRRF